MLVCINCKEELIEELKGITWHEIKTKRKTTICICNYCLRENRRDDVSARNS